MSSDCQACRLTNGVDPLPGGRIVATDHWLVEHCVGPLGVGTLIVKPFRHCLHVAELTSAESQEFGPLLQRTSQVIHDLTQADQIYTCFWGHGGWKPVHIHFVVQPVWNHMRDTYPGPGPSLQAAMFQAKQMPPLAEVKTFCQQARQRFAQAV